MRSGLFSRIFNCNPEFFLSPKSAYLMQVKIFFFFLVFQMKPMGGDVP